MAGDEIVQIYLKTPDSKASLQRPIKRLKGFQRLTIPAGQTKTVSIGIDCSDLWFWDAEKERITFDQGKYIFEIAASSKKIKGQVEAEMNGIFKPVLQTLVAECGKVVLNPGNKVQTSVTASLSDDSFFDITNAKVIYKSSNPTVASVDAKGMVTAIGPGVATIAAEVTIDGTTKTGSYPLKVMADLTLGSISKDGQPIANFKPDNHSYSYLIKDVSAKIPVISARSSVEGIKINVTQASSLPGTALISLSDDISGQSGSYTVNFGTSSYSDEFETSSLNEHWTWLRENKDNWTLSESPGKMILTAGKGDLKGSRNNASNILLQSANTDWSIESKMEFSKRPEAPDQQGGLIAYQDDDNYVKLVYINSSKGFMGSDGYFELLVEREGAQYSAANILTAGIIPADRTLTFKLEKTGSRYKAYYSTGGKDFEFLGSTDVVLRDVSAGLITCGGGAAPEGDLVAGMMGIRSGSEEKPLRIKIDNFRIVNAGN